jgi:ParB family chromosome partitioning protein
MMTLQDLLTIDIPLHKLTLWDDNVRSSGAEDGLAELIASITSVGLLHSLVVQKAKRGQYAVVAGKRRFLALSQMAETGNVKRSFPVPCRVAPEDVDLTEISLAENVVRLEMPVLSEVQAFLRLVEAGKCVADVAARFGVSEAVVNRRLALARVSPVLLDLYGNDEMPLDVLQAFTLTDDHATQERVWNELQPWNRKPHTIRQILSNEDIPATDKRVRFVGLAAYEAAGGNVKRDLFSEDEDGAYIADAALLTRLADEKSQTMAAQATAEGWKWVQVQPDTDHQALGKFRRIQPIPTPLPKKDAASVAKLEKKQSQLQARMETDPDADENEIYDQIEALQEEIDAIEANHPATFDADTKAHCGAVVTIGHNGEPQVVYGLMRKEDAAQLGNTQENGAEGEATAEAPIVDQPPPAYSAVLVETLTTIKTAAIAAELSHRFHKYQNVLSGL